MAARVSAPQRHCVALHYPGECLMARSYANVATAIWRDDDFRVLTVAEQHAYFLLISQSDISAAGVLTLALTRWASRANDATRASLRDALEGLQAHRFVVIDEETEEILVRSFVRWDGGYTNSKRRFSIRDAAAQVESGTLRRALAEEFARLDLPADWIPAFPQMDSPSDGASDALSIGHGRATAKNSDIGRVVVSTCTTGEPTTLNPQSSNRVPARSADAGEPARKRGTRIPEDFAVTTEMVTWARENAPNINGAYETQKFVDYWRGRTGKDATKLDWIGTWRNWIRKAQEDTQRGSRGVATGANRHNAQRHDNPFAEV
jgi:hypothetical protein